MNIKPYGSWLQCRHSASQQIGKAVTIGPLNLSPPAHFAPSFPLLLKLLLGSYRTKKRCGFHYRGLECRSRKSRDTLGNRQIWPWSTEWSRAKANRVLPREHTGHSKHPLPTTPEKTLHMDITRWSMQKSDWLCSLQPKMEKLYTVSENKTGSWLWLKSWTPYCQIQT